MKKLTLTAVTVSLALTAGAAFAGDHWKDKFDAADTSKDGALSMAEWNAESQMKFNELDANKDGKVTWAEKEAGHKAMKGDHADSSHERVTDASKQPSSTKKLNPDNTPPANAKD